jgi:RHS repeat-associated protein
VTGKEIAVYSGNNVEQWNLWGADNIGNFKSNGDKFYYLKDHLGTIRAVLDSNNNIIAANDYDCWGYPLESRSYEPVNQRYKFTSKERDRESSTDGNGYDYFGARYYDSRIGRWHQVEPKLDGYVDITPYNYSLDNPIILLDPNGKDPRRNQMANLNEVVNLLEANKDQSIKEFIVNELPGNESKRYVYTEQGGFIDLMHFFAAALVTSKLLPLDPFGGPGAEYFGRQLGEFMEIFQTISSDDSEWDPEDMPSNVQGAEFGLEIGFSGKITGEFIEKFKKYMNEQKILDKDDPSIARNKVRIRENQYDTPLPNRMFDPDPYRPYRGEPVAGRGIRGIKN